LPCLSSFFFFSSVHLQYLWNSLHPLTVTLTLTLTLILTLPTYPLPPLLLPYPQTPKKKKNVMAAWSWIQF
jgi:hypothetical protein